MIENNLENPELGVRKVPFGRELYIERNDFMIDPPKKYFRLFPGNEVRLMHAYFVKCVSYETDAEGNVTVVHCTYDPETKCGTGFTGRKVKGTIHWVSAPQAKKAEVRLYENLIDTQEASSAFREAVILFPRKADRQKNCVKPVVKSLIWL